MEDRDQLKTSFTTTYDELLEPIFRYLFFRLRDRERARELAQETFMKTWSYLIQGNEIRNMRAFLYTTAGNLFKNELRAKRDVTSLDTMMEASAFEPETDDISADEYAEGTLLMEKLDLLKPEYKEVLLMRYVDGLPVRDIADILGHSAVTVSVRIHRALKKLKAVHEPEFPHE